MKLVPETLNELHKFQRGQDPRKSMDVGINPLVKNIDSDDLFLLFNITNLATGGITPLEVFRRHPIYGNMDPEWLEEIYQRGIRYHELLSPYLKWGGSIDSYEEAKEIDDKAKLEGKYAYDFTPEGNHISYVISDIELPKADLVIDTAEYLEGQTWRDRTNWTNENVNFERGKDPKRGLRIGMNHLIPEITSYDLEAISTIMEDGASSFEEFVDFHGIDTDDPEEMAEAKRDYDRFQDIIIAIGNDIQFGEYKDWKEFGEVRDYLKHNTPEDKPYVYNAFPEGDGIQIVFSSIELPSADEIDPYDDAFDPD
jgi:hypothetical protein